MGERERFMVYICPECGYLGQHSSGKHECPVCEAAILVRTPVVPASSLIALRTHLEAVEAARERLERLVEKFRDALSEGLSAVMHHAHGTDEEPACERCGEALALLHEAHEAAIAAVANWEALGEEKTKAEQSWEKSPFGGVETGYDKP